MCKLSNLYVLDLFDKTVDNGSIVFNVANSLPQLMNTPCKIVVKQIQTELKDDTVDINASLYLRVIHNIIIQSGSNLSGFSSSNTLAFIDSFQARTINNLQITGFTTAECKLFAPAGLPAILTLRRASGQNMSIIDDPTLSWSVRLEITINPDQE
jgi:hypothetical protein